MPLEQTIEAPGKAADLHLKSTQDEPTKVGFVSLGCPKNLVDSEVMMGILVNSGASLTTTLRFKPAASPLVIRTSTPIRRAACCSPLARWSTRAV